ncbi:MAG: YceI family protein [Leptospiraceae bacterium]|nr:YceI family protein [Leptospiraceae bacterium]
MNYIILFILFFHSVYANNCEFSYDPKTTEFAWKAFKFTEKTGVGGTFDKINTPEKLNAKSIAQLAEKLKFTIDTNTVNTKNPDRDAKIKKFFFGSFKDSKISGSFKKIKIENEKGTAELVLKLNGIEKTHPVNFTLKNNKELELVTSIDVVNWKAKAGIDALNKECNALHIGKDGVSKLWSEVELSIKTSFVSACK